MDEARFEAAVQIAREVRQQVETTLSTPPEAMARGYRRVRADRQPMLLAQMLWCSSAIRTAWDSVRLIARQRLRDGEPLPPELASWVADVLEDVSKPRAEKKRPRPTVRGRHAPDAYFVRNRAIVDAVQWLTHQGFRATRNKPVEEACAEGGSACDAVGVAFGKEKYKAVEKVWTDSANPNSAFWRRPFEVVGVVPDSSPVRVFMSYASAPDK